MNDTETYGGSCPKCEKPMFQKGPAYHGWLAFDACPWCGFAYGEVNNVTVEKTEEIWESILDHHQCTSREQLINMYNLETETPDDIFKGNVFTYDKTAS